VIKWLKYEKLVIFRDKSKGGLLSQFLKEYKSEFGGSINPSCMTCLNSYYNNFIEKYTMSDIIRNTEFVLKAKYNNIKSKTNGRPCRNADLTDEQAIDLIENHPHGVNLFEFIPESYYTKNIEVEIEEIKPTEIKETTKKKTSKKRK